jgi:hypothetical protein
MHAYVYVYIVLLHSRFYRAHARRFVLTATSLMKKIVSKSRIFATPLTASNPEGTD